jgi:hypothetical protein
MHTITRKRLGFNALLILLLMVVSCETGGGGDGEGRIVLSSIFDYESSKTRGFNFEEEQFMEFPAATATSPQPDIIIETYKRVDAPPKPGFTSPGNENGFALLGVFDDLTTSEDFYNNYLEVDTSLTLNSSTDTVRLYQVWILRTALGNYAKLLVRDIRNYDDMAGEYMEVTVDYHYRDDGTPRFPG